MAGKIPQQFIDDLISRTDIVEIINQRVPLKKAGREYQACCPFHGEKTPSFTVSPTKQFYHCFGCGAHGTALGFIMEYDRLSFPEAVEELANHIGLEVPREIGFDKGPDNRPLYDALERTSDYYQQQLRHHPQANLATDYLKGRGLSGQIAADFKLGYAPPGWDNLIRHFGDTKEKNSLLDKAGLITQNDNKTYDRLRERVIFPILDTRGRTIGFGGRILGDGKPKYLNSPETPVFHKGRELYGLYQARQANRELTRLIVVEGYMDVVALAQFGITYAVATLGTATTSDHLEKLYRATHEVVFCFDGDRAGKDAAWKALNVALPLMKDGRQARFLFLPDGEDPDTLVRQIGQQAFEELLQKSQPLSEFLLEKLASQVDVNSIDGRARLAELAKPLIKQIPNETFRELMQNELDKRTGMNAQIAAQIAEPAVQQRSAAKAISSNQAQMTPVRKAIAILLQHPEVAHDEALPTAWKASDMPGVDILAELIAFCDTHSNATTANLLEHCQDPKLQQHLSALAAARLLLQDDAQEQFTGSLKIIGEKVVKQQRSNTHQALKPSQLSEEEKQRLRELYRRPQDNIEDSN